MSFLCKFTLTLYKQKRKLDDYRNIYFMEVTNRVLQQQPLFGGFRGINL